MKRSLLLILLAPLFCVQAQQPLPTARTYPAPPPGNQATAQLGSQPGFTGQPKAAAPAGAQESTVITAEKLTFDYKRAFALFEQDVVVDDPGIFLTCESMEVRFDEKDEVETIVAKGQVQIQQEDFAARSEIATYDVKSGDILLEVNPVVRKGQDLLKGGVIRYNRFDEKLVSTGGVRVILHKKEGAKSALPMRGGARP